MFIDDADVFCYGDTRPVRILLYKWATRQFLTSLIISKINSTRKTWARDSAPLNNMFVSTVCVD